MKFIEGILLVLSTGLLLITAEEHKCIPQKCTVNNTCLYDSLWKANTDIANDVLKTEFLTLMVKGSLKAERYMKFTLQDIYYANEVTKLLNILAKTARTSKDIKKFFIDMHSSYAGFTKYLLEEFRFKKFTELIPSNAAKSYVDSYKALMKEKPIYFVIGLLPCSKLWPYIAQNLDISDSSPYIDFKNGNMKDDSWKRFGELLETHRCKIKENKAHKIFRSHMKHEYLFFHSQ
ncbi:uncharacterized protein LOC122810856 [Protopterus annectens]|uniref:uncharacterized protein LOC122810856 n=1 Tax=Protopterus annectens TaxID=7888 RepID=UPI001CFC22B1|nr:uncharacterized protein LOC122810856 [Protopterus annectens]